MEATNMTIEIIKAPDRIHIRQSFDSPTVYLDHWAIRRFSDDISLQKRFVRALQTKKGTLLLSTLSLFEFSRISDERHFGDTETFLDRLLPNIYLSDFDLEKQLKQEQSTPNTTKLYWPSTDHAQIYYLTRLAENSSRDFTMKGYYKLTRKNKTKLSELMQNVANNIVNRTQNIRSDTELANAAKTFPPRSDRQRTNIILTELIRNFILDPTIQMTENDAIDFLHASVSVNCCDYVLLDGPWTERVANMSRRIKRAGINMPIARCFSERRNGLEKFMVALEVFEKE